MSDDDWDPCGPPRCDVCGTELVTVENQQGHDSLGCPLCYAQRQARVWRAEWVAVCKVVAADCVTQPCGHAAKWLAYRNAVDPTGERYCVFCEMASLRQQLVEAQARNERTYCAYCGHEEPIDGDGSLIAEHIRTCDKHPMRAVEQELAAARAFDTDLRDWLGSVIVTNFLHQYRNQCFQMQGRYDGSMSDECVEAFKRAQRTTEQLIQMAKDEAARAAGGAE